MKRSLYLAVLLILMSHVASAHIRIYPTESTAGAREMYKMRVPNEKDAISSTRIELEFPAGIDVYAFEPIPGWKLETKKGTGGKFVSAVWTGKLGPHEFLEFGMLAINPKEGTSMVWKAVQFYDDGTKEEFIGAAGSKLPAPVVVLKK